MSQFLSFPYTVGGPVTTDMVVARGFLKNPQNYDVIPEESKASPIFVFTDETVGRIYGENFANSLKAQGYTVHLITLPDGENTKTIECYVATIERIIEIGPDDGSVFVSVGGGVICNLCGFIASTIYRGLTLIHVPTSLMAQCDAAISHKQGLNGKKGKNLIGSYYSPTKVFVDVEALKTLDVRLLRDGMAEVIKHALCHSQEYVDLLLEAPENFWDDSLFMEKVVVRNIEHKCKLAAVDPHEDHEGVILLYGHSTGHPIEFLSRGELYHGEAVGLGMLLCAKISEIAGFSDKDLTSLHLKLLQKFSLPTKLPENLDFETFSGACRYDKKYLSDSVRMGLLRNVGEIHTEKGEHLVSVPADLLKESFLQMKKGDL